jgi:hypothetical protein
MSEERLYEHYLNNSGIKIRNEQGDLDYDKIFNILKFDFSIPFVGGNKRDFGVFAVVRILETKFNTRLGLPPRHQHRFGPVVRSFVDKRRLLWMGYLQEGGWVKISNEPYSFTDYDVY